MDMDAHDGRYRTNDIAVMVRDGKHAGPGGYDDYSTVTVTVSLPSAPVLSSVGFSPGALSL